MSMTAIQTSPFSGHSLPSLVYSPRIGHALILFSRIVVIYLDGPIIMGSNMDNVYFSPGFHSVLDSTGSCGNIAEDGDVVDWFIE